MDNGMINIEDRFGSRYRPWKIRRNKDAVFVFKDRFVEVGGGCRITNVIVDGTLTLRGNATAANVIVRKGGKVIVSGGALLDNAFFYKGAGITVYPRGRAMNIKTTGHVDARLYPRSEIQMVADGPIRADWLNN